jgi:hypothetical protein
MGNHAPPELAVLMAISFGEVPWLKADPEKLRNKKIPEKRNPVFIHLFFMILLLSNSILCNTFAF